MHSTLYNHIEAQITDASTFVLRHMPIGLSPEQIYEDLVGDPKIAQVFADAAQYLPPSSLNRRTFVDTEEYGMLSLNMRLPPTERYPQYLMPHVALTLTRQSELSRALALPLRVARDWAMLAHVFRVLANDIADMRAMACIMPWIRELVAEWQRTNPRPKHLYKPVKEWRLLYHEVDAIVSEKPPKRFPRLTQPLNAVCLSGKALFSQHRMLASCTSPTVSPVIVGKTDSVPDWLGVHLTEVLEDWREEQEKLNEQEQRST